MTGPEELSGAERERLRLALRMIAEEADRPEPVAAAPRRAPGWRRRAVFFTAGMAAAAALAGTLVHEKVRPYDGGARKQAAQADGEIENQRGVASGAELDETRTGWRNGGELSDAEWVACARVVVDGEVTAVRKGAREGRIRVTMDVREWIKPARGGKRLELDVVDPAVAEEAQEPWRLGRNTLAVVPQRRESAADVFHDEERTFARRAIDRVLSAQKATTCRGDR
ncbi:hypothetical protein [Streptomyces clavuligerus]|uniref:Uncharacterized protein n=1 Tax=Streptomyces clavuligerus TaxID=1901 RepID=B5H2R3_STRCL|nr:hypothetical protein [Streptomyces clavuligerus]ANW18929.1 hypothetical protein BB341_12140 [Streptomyces clavuligerus]AXU13505.1 hypothetical protein D1794_12575 [Streptomyces clavuligerus]EDY52859.1 hypothetical protein SSCG_05929 [Streptomyces clavuligerus]EFG08365.1 Hypothetical protein SCLAV_3294 [Streptomyces clavuligerus]MBY6303463.1 hypothetical protein [Streptomyces clavuligerus]